MMSSHEENEASGMAAVTAREKGESILPGMTPSGQTSCLNGDDRQAAWQRRQNSAFLPQFHSVDRILPLYVIVFFPIWRVRLRSEDDSQ